MARLLIIDDEPEFSEAFSHALAAVGYAVKTCTSGTAAIELFRRERADLVFCDLRLPGLDGLEVLEALKGIDPAATVVMMTGYGSTDTAIHALRLGAYDFLEKPCSVTQVQQVTQRALDYRRQMKQLSHLEGQNDSKLPNRLMEIEQMRADFLKLAIQELRAPLRLLSEALTLAQEGFYGPWDHPLKFPFLNPLRRVEHLLSRTLLGAVALFVGHEQRVNPALSDIKRLVNEAIRQYQPQAEERQVAFKGVLPSDPVEGKTDLEKVGFIVRELLEDALTSTPKGGWVEVSLICLGERGFRLEIGHAGRGSFLEEKGPAQYPVGGLGAVLVRHYLELLRGSFETKSHLSTETRFAVTVPWWKSNGD